MPMHHWGDDSFDWNALWSSINYITHTWTRWGRIGTHGKEKYGTFRDQSSLWDGSLWHLCQPNAIYYGRQPWLFIHGKIDYVFVPLMKYLGIRWLFLKWQAVVYNYAVQKMCKKYPHIIDELVSDLDYYELVKPGFFGKVSGEEIHNKYWRRIGAE